MEAMITRTSTGQTLRTNSLPMRLYEKAKEGGGWNPSRLDFSADQAHWDSLKGQDRVPVLAIAVLSAHGLRSQMHNQARMLVPIERYGTIEESLCHSSHMFETARFVEFHNRLLEDLFHLVGDPQRFHLTRFRTFFGEHLPEVFDRLEVNADRRTLVEALTLTGPLGKGVLGATSSYMMSSMLQRLEIMPTTLSTIRAMRTAERRHTEFENFFISKLVEQDPTLWEVVDETMHAGFEPSIGMVREFFDKFTNTQIARAEAVTYAVERFSECYERLEKAKEPTFVDHGSRARS
jgi:ribonucleoside-diphosphate reductase beta chain